MRITRITLKDFMAFKGECTIDLKAGCNLLLYGENGSGKSSLFQALTCFFAPDTPFGDHKNIFVTTDDGFVKLEIGDGTNPSKTYEWETTTHPFTEPLIVETSKTKGFLDYRSLLETHFVHRHTDSVNAFDLLVNSLLVNAQNPLTRSTLGEEWRHIQDLVAQRRGSRRNSRLDEAISDFNAGLTQLLGDLSSKSNEILALFEQNVTVQLAFAGQGLQVASAGRHVENRTVALTAEYYGRAVSRHHHFLNEARLSAIAVSIYLSALLLNPPSQLRVLFLDDVLIGLDMSNRLPLLGILQRFFADWQVILATYDRVWFDMVWQRGKDMGSWQRGELFCCSDGQCDVPVYKGNGDYLAVATKHLDSGDLKAAAIYIRSAYELVIKRFCDRHHLAVRYCEKPKDQRSEDFWQVVKARKLGTGADLLDAELVSDVELFRSTVLNQLSHTAPVSLVRKEVEEAHKAVESLTHRLHQVKECKLKKA